MHSKFFISCHKLGYYSQLDSGENLIQKWDIRDLTLKFFAGDRVRFRFNNNDQKDVLLRLFLQKLKPKKGSFFISSKTHIYSDYNFWERTNKKASLQENMKSKLFSSRPWFGGHRKNLDILIDRLDLGGRKQHIPVQELSLEQKNRFRILMMIAAKTKVILIDNLFTELDEIGMLFILEWLENFLGIVILFGDYPNQIKPNRNIKMSKRDESKPLFNSIISFSGDGLPKIFNDLK